MGWLNRVLGRERPERATPTEVAESLAAVIANNTDELVTEFSTQNIEELAPGRLDTLEFRVECLLFVWFAMDVIIVREFRSHGDAIRDRVARRLFESVFRTQLLSGEQFTEADLERGRITRFTEYMEALRHGEGTQNGAERLGNLAWVRILGRRQPSFIHPLMLATRAMAVFKSYKGIGSRFEVVAEAH